MGRFPGDPDSYQSDSPANRSKQSGFVLRRSNINHTMINKIIKLAVTITGAVIVTVLVIRLIPQSAEGSAFPGTGALVASSSRLVFSGSDNTMTLFATTTGCVSRVITTASSSIAFTLRDGHIPTGQGSGAFGHMQDASTTIAYDSAIWGCGKWTVRPNAAGTVITATDLVGGF